MFLIMGMNDIEINEKKKWLEEFPQNGRYLPLKISKNDKVVMMDSQTGDLYFPSNDGWKLDMNKKQSELNEKTTINSITYCWV